MIAIKAQSHRWHRRKPLILLLMFALAYGVYPLPACAVSNLLPDGGFEEGQWSLTKWDHGEAKHEFTTEARTGHKAVKLTGINGEKAAINVLCYSPPVDIEADAEYVLSVWYRTTGSAAPFVSILTYREPWAKDQWKTPSTAYESRHMPEAEQWTPFTYRFRAAPQSKQLVAAVRCGGVGTVWFDDIALFPASAAKMDVREEGTITTYPDERRLKVRLTVGAQTRHWNVFLLDTKSGRKLASREGRSSPVTIELTYTAKEGAELLLGLEDMISRAVLETTRVIPPPLVKLTVTSPRYRDSLYLSLKPKFVRAELLCAADATLRGGMAYAASLREEALHVWRPMTPRNDLRVSLPASVTSRTLTLAVHLKGVPGMQRLSAALKVVPPASAGREVIIGDANETLVDGKPFFPAGFYGMPMGAQSDLIAKAGYTAALTYNTKVESCKQWLDECSRLGLLGMVSIPHPFVARFDEGKLREAIRSVKHHPSLLGYYLIDEPYPGKPGQSPAELKRVYDVLVDEDPYHPVGVCINIPEYTDDYADCFDIVMPDPYPLLKTIRPLTTVSDRVETSREALADRKPVWVVLQAFGWDIIESAADPLTYRTPTPEQERCMTYLALTHGVRGVMYYCYHVYTKFDKEKEKAGGWPWVLGGYLPEKQPVLWRELARLGAEMKRLAPMLAQPLVESGLSGSVHWRFFPRRGMGANWLIAVNANETRTTTMVFSRPEWNILGVRTVFGPGRATLTKDGVLVILPPMGTVAAEFVECKE